MYITRSNLHVGVEEGAAGFGWAMGEQREKKLSELLQN